MLRCSFSIAWMATAHSLNVGMSRTQVRRIDPTDPGVGGPPGVDVDLLARNVGRDFRLQVHIDHVQPRPVCQIHLHVHDGPLDVRVFEATYFVAVLTLGQISPWFGQ